MDKKTRKFGRLFMAATVCAMSLFAASCSSNEDEPKPDNNNPEVSYKGNVAYSAGLVFNGNELGNGTQNYHLTGDVTLKKGTYILKGWVYVDEGAKLTIPAGTVIKGEKETMAALIIEPGGYCEMKGTSL